MATDSTAQGRIPLPALLGGATMSHARPPQRQKKYLGKVVHPWELMIIAALLAPFSHFPGMNSTKAPYSPAAIHGSKLSIPVAAPLDAASDHGYQILNLALYTQYFQTETLPITRNPSEAIPPTIAIHIVTNIPLPGFRTGQWVGSFSIRTSAQL